MTLEYFDHILTTTRSVRKRLDLTRPVEPDVIRQCLEIAVQAPTGSNIPQYFFLVVTDAERRARLADVYRKTFDEMFRGIAVAAWNSGIRDSGRTLAGRILHRQRLQTRQTAIGP